MRSGAIVLHRVSLSIVMVMVIVTVAVVREEMMWHWRIMPNDC